MTAATLIIHVREYHGVYIALCNKTQASCTSSPEEAARRAARKAAEVLLTLRIISEIPEHLELKEIAAPVLYTAELPTTPSHQSPSSHQSHP